MGQFLYERPREKLTRIGAASLSNSELLQVVIGSGVKGYPVQKVARKVEKILQRQGVRITQSDIQSIRGIGRARASLIIAVFELASRFITHEQKMVYKTAQDIQQLALQVVPTLNESLAVFLLDGASRVIHQLQYQNQNRALTAALLREAIKHNAVEIFLVFAQKGREYALQLNELALVRSVTQLAVPLAIRVKSVAVVSTKGALIISGSQHE